MKFGEWLNKEKINEKSKTNIIIDLARYNGWEDMFWSLWERVGYMGSSKLQDKILEDMEKGKDL